MQEEAPKNDKPNFKQTSLELLFDNMTFIEQFAESVVSYTSKYNSSLSILYAPENLIGKPSKYPLYGDFPDTYMLRSYGEWWNYSAAAQAHYMPSDLETIVSEDYVTVRFEYAVIPQSVSVYETYNPGAVVKLWAKTVGGVWILLWEGAPDRGIHAARKFTPSLRQIRELINEVRIDLNQSFLNYHTSLDAVLLAGYKPKSVIQTSLLLKGLYDTIIPDKERPKTVVKAYEETDCDSKDLFATLPHEVMVHIFQYLDLRSLCRSAQVNRKWHVTSLDSVLYKKLSLKRHWNKINNNTIMYFMTRTRNMKKLDLSWCGNDKQITEETFVQFIQKSGRHLSHLSLGYCGFLGSASLKEIGNLHDLTDLRLRNCQCHPLQYTALTQLKKLVSLDFYSSSIIDEVLINILKSNPGLKHLILDLCEHLERLDDIAETVSTCNWRLISWSSWKTHSLTSVGIGYLSMCTYLRELDVGWCLILSEPGDCLERIAMGCKYLQRLIISGWRGVTDHLLLPIIRSCKLLIELDLLGIKNLSGDICDRILDSLPKLELLDISFCDLIRQEQVYIWRNQYPGVVIQRSISP